MKQRIAVVGLGYVGIPLAIAAAKNDFAVVGIDIDETKIRDLTHSKFEGQPSLFEFQKQILDGNIEVTSDFIEVSNCEIIVIAVPTPLDLNRHADLSKLNLAVESISRFCKKNVVIIIESTVAPGTVRTIVLPLIKKITGFKESEFELAYSPERIDPGNPQWNLENTPKLVAGITSSAKERAVEFYNKFLDTVVECTTVEIAETAKLIENSFRLVNISFINEVSMFCSKLGIDMQEVVRAASTKPYGFMSFYPSIGVGGHCIPVDPIYLSEKARSIGLQIEMVEVASKINLQMPKYFVAKAEEMLISLNGKRIMVIGVSYKPDISDTRETPVEDLIIGLRAKGATVSWHDDLVGKWRGESSSSLSNHFDLAILATPHSYLDLNKIGDVPLLNTRI